MSLKVVPFDRLCGFLLVFYRNFVLKTHRFLRYSTCNYKVTLKHGLGVTQGHRSATYDFILTIYSNHLVPFQR